MTTRIKELRNKHGLTLTELAERLNVNYTTVCKWENKGVIPRPQAIKICNEFGCDIEWLLPGHTEKKDDDKTVIGQRLQEVRACLNWTVEEMAEQLDVSKGTVSLWENNGTIPARRLRVIAEKCNVSYDWLTTGKGKMFSNEESSPKLGEPKDLAVMYGFDHRTAEAIERYAQLPAEKRLEFSETLAYVMLGRPAVGTAKINASYEIAENVATIKKTLVRHDAHHADLSETKADAEVKLSPEEIETIEKTEANAESEELAEIQKDKPR